MTLNDCLSIFPINEFPKQCVIAGTNFLVEVCKDNSFNICENSRGRYPFVFRNMQEIFNSDYFEKHDFDFVLLNLQFFETLFFVKKVKTPERLIKYEELHNYEFIFS